MGGGASASDWELRWAGLQPQTGRAGGRGFTLILGAQVGEASALCWELRWAGFQPQTGSCGSNGRPHTKGHHKGQAALGGLQSLVGGWKEDLKEPERLVVGGGSGGGGKVLETPSQRRSYKNPPAEIKDEAQLGPPHPPRRSPTSLIFTSSRFTRRSAKFRAGLEMEDRTERTEAAI